MKHMKNLPQKEISASFWNLNFKIKKYKPLETDPTQLLNFVTPESILVTECMPQRIIAGDGNNLSQSTRPEVHSTHW